MISASKENTKALNERQAKQAQEITNVLSSVPITFKQESLDRLSDKLKIKTTTGRTAGRFGRQEADAARSDARMYARERKKVLLESMESMAIDEKVMINKLEFTESGSLKTDKQGSLVTTPTAMGRKEIAQMINKIKTTDPASQKALEDLLNQRRAMNEKASIDEDKERKAIRIRLNLQKAIMLAQMEAKKAQIDIKEKYFNQSNDRSSN